MKRLLALLTFAVPATIHPAAHADDFRNHRRNWVWSTAHAIPKETTSEGSGYFSIIEGRNGRLYIGTAKYRHNAYLVEFDPATGGMRTVVDAHGEIGTDATGFAAQAKFHTRNNVGASGRIYLGTKQGYPQDGEERSDYPGGYPMVYDPETGAITRAGTRWSTTRRRAKRGSIRFRCRIMASSASRRMSRGGSPISPPATMHGRSRVHIS